METYVEDFINLVKSKYDEYHRNRNHLLNDLNIFYILEFTFVTDNNMVRCLWHKDWDYIHIHWNFHAQEYLDKKTVVWSVPRDVPLKEMAIQFSGLGETLFKNTALQRLRVSEFSEL